MATRIYLTGRLCIETDACTVGEDSIPTSQGRLLLAFLTAERTAPAAVDELAAQLWPTAADPASVVDEVVAGVRQLLAAADLPPESLRCGFGCYQLRVPVDLWVDIDAAREAVQEAEVEIRVAGPGEAADRHHGARLATTSRPWCGMRQ